MVIVDRAFKMIKKCLLSIQPVYHWKEKRIRTHTFLCMLAYYVVLEFKKRLGGLFSENECGRNYKWTLEEILRKLKEIKLRYMRVRDVKIL